MEHGRFMYLFMGVLWGHFSSSNSPGILAQELDIHICVNEISFRALLGFHFTCSDSHMTCCFALRCRFFSNYFQSYRQTLLFRLLLHALKLKQHFNLPGAHGSTTSSRSVASPIVC